jgi:hypothetical protein
MDGGKFFDEEPVEPLLPGPCIAMIAGFAAARGLHAQAALRRGSIRIICPFRYVGYSMSHL